MKMFFAFVACCLVYGVSASGSGRAFPISSENYAIDAFQRINRGIEWDKTNFLVDLSGLYANCDQVGINDFVKVDKVNAVGSSIGGFVDDTFGSESHVDAVNAYITEVIDRWVSGNAGQDIISQIMQADTFGCSVRPGCRGSRVSVACLFTPEYRGSSDNIGKIDALAFTKDQYIVAEDVTGRVWGRDHFLENLSGFDTQCAMVHLHEYSFPKTITIAKERGMRLEGRFGVAPNVGETEPAMIQILENMKAPYMGQKVGCSIIPDCFENNMMYVVVGCVFQI